MKTTKKHFQYFRERCEYWIEVFGLKQWTIAYFHGGVAEDHYAECYAKNGTQVASLSLAKSFGSLGFEDYDSQDHLNRLALQEVIHVLLEPLDDRFVSTEVMGSRHEAVAHMIEHALLGRPKCCVPVKKKV